MERFGPTASNFGYDFWTENGPKNHNNSDGLPVAGGESNLQMLNLAKLSFFRHPVSRSSPMQWDSPPLGKNSYNKVPALQKYFLFIRRIFLPRPRSKGIMMIV